MKPLRMALTVLVLSTCTVAAGKKEGGSSTAEAAATTTSTTVLSLKAPAQATKKAVRGVMWQETPQPVVGLNGMPFAPTGLSDCDEMQFYRIQAGLPSRFDALGWRESNCRNEEGVRTFCCYGYWQIYYSLHADKLFHFCGVTNVYDINGDEPLDKQKNACSAKVLFNESGYAPWGL